MRKNSPQKVTPTQKLATLATPKAPEDEVAQFWLSGRPNRHRGAIVPPSRLSHLLNPRWLPAPRDNTTENKLPRSPYAPIIQRHSTTGVKSRWYAEHLGCDWTLKKVCRLPPAILDRTFTLLNDLVDEVSTSNEADQVLPGKAAGLDPWEELMPAAANSESDITTFYSSLLYQTFLPALSMLLTRKHLNAAVHGECQNHPRFFKVSNDNKDQSITQSRVMVHPRSTPKPDVLVSLETFEETRRAALFNERLTDKENDNPNQVAFTLDAVAPGLQHLALGETKTPNSAQGAVLSATELPGGAWNIPQRQCTCTVADHTAPESNHVGKHNWDYKKVDGIGQSRDAEREELLWEALGVTRPTPPTDVETPHLNEDNKRIFFDLCNQMWVGMVAYGVVIGWCTTWYTGTRLVIRSPSKHTLFVSDVLNTPLLDKDNRQQAAERNIRNNSPPYDRDREAQHNNKTAIKAMVAATLVALKVRMAEINKPDEGWLEVTDPNSWERQQGVLKSLQVELIENHLGLLPEKYPDVGLAAMFAQEDDDGDNEEGEGGGGDDGGGEGGGGDDEGGAARGRKRKSSKSQTGRNVRGRTRATGRCLTTVLEDALTPSGYGIEQLHIRFHVGLLDSCRVDIFVPAEFEDVTSSMSLVYSNAQKGGDAGKQMSSGRSQVPPRVPATTLLPTLPLTVRRARMALGLVVTGLLSEGHRSDVLKVEASLLQADEDEGEVPTALMALKVSCGPEGLAALQSEYRVYKYLATSKNGHQLNLPKAYGVFRFGVEGIGGGVVGGLLLSYEPGVPAWQLSAEKWCEVRPQVQGAVNELHERGVVHGDLAMRNILVGEGGRICLVDFEHAANTRDPTLQGHDLFRLNNMWGERTVKERGTVGRHEGLA